MSIDEYTDTIKWLRDINNISKEGKDTGNGSNNGSNNRGTGKQVFTIGGSNSGYGGEGKITWKDVKYARREDRMLMLELYRAQLQHHGRMADVNSRVDIAKLNANAEANKPAEPSFYDKELFKSDLRERSKQVDRMLEQYRHEGDMEHKRTQLALDAFNTDREFDHKASSEGEAKIFEIVSRTSDKPDVARARAARLNYTARELNIEDHGDLQIVNAALMSLEDLNPDITAKQWLTAFQNRKPALFSINEVIVTIDGTEYGLSTEQFKHLVRLQKIAGVHE
jgi:hypothetical protein